MHENNYSVNVNKCIGDDTKTAARRSPNSIRKNGYLFHYRKSVKNCFRTQTFTEIGQSADELWPKNDFQYGVCPPSLIFKISYLVT